MKKYILLTIATALLSTTLRADYPAQDSTRHNRQDEIQTLFKLKSINAHGGYLGLGARYSMIDGRDAIEVGGRAAWIANHHLAIGFGGYGFFNAPRQDQFLITNETNTNEFSLQGGYGGLLVEPIFFAKYPVHIALPIIVGGGGVSYNENRDYEGFDHEEERSFTKDAAFFVLNPGVEVELNMLRFVRLAFGAYYRYTSPVTLEYSNYPGVKVMDSDALNGFSFGTTLKIGYF